MKINKSSKINNFISDKRFTLEMTKKIQNEKNLKNLEIKFLELCKKSTVKRFDFKRKIKILFIKNGGKKKFIKK